MTDHASAEWREVRFRKSSFSGSAGGNCVEVALSNAGLGVRDSKNPIGPVIAVRTEQGTAFLHAIKINLFSV
jgi:uncharacterized protein DUF397